MATRGRLRAAGLACVLALAATVPPALAGSAPPCGTETEPNDAPEQASTFTSAICLDGTLPDGDQDIYIWDISGLPAQRWSMTLTGVPGTVTGVKLLEITSDPGVTPVGVGSQDFQLTSTPTDLGPVQATDLLITPGRYLLGVARSAAADGGTPPSLAYHVTIEPGSALPAAKDKEPNDDAAHAGAVAGAFSLSGNLQGSDDYFKWTVPASSGSEPDRWQLSLQGELGSTVVLVLLGGNGTELVRNSSGGDRNLVALHDLVLKPGKYLLQVGNGTALDRPYVLTASHETSTNGDPEPNNTPETATPIRPGDPQTGRLAEPSDRDLYLLHVDDTLAATLMDIRLIWQFGPDRQLCLLDSAGTQLVCRSGDTGDTLPNLFLPVGDYTVQVAGDPSPSAPYILRIDTTTAPAPDFETEPNDTGATASSWTPGTVMRGRETVGDYDYFRVTVSGAPQLWQMTVTGAQINALHWVKRDGTGLEDGAVATGNQSAALEDMYLVPGDHWVRVDAVGDYSLAMTPLGPPDPNGEVEPNNDSLHAQALKLGKPRTGRIVRYNDLDISRFSLQAAERLRLRITPPADGAVAWGIYAADSTEMARDRVPQTGVPVDQVVSLPPGDYELWLNPGVMSTGHYTVEIDREDPFTPTTALATTVAVTTTTAAPAAYWSAGQHVSGTVSLTNTTGADQTFSLDLALSDVRWAATLAQTQLTLTAGASVSVPLTIDVPPDAWADNTVRLTVRARDASSAQATGFVELTPGRVAAPVDPYQAWPVPDALLGGLDVASLALGATPVPRYNADSEPLLYDGYTPAGGGFGQDITALPATFETDLAGDAAVPIAGMILNPQARNAGIGDAPKDVELLVSDDGTTWRSVFTGTMTPLGVDQPFVLPAPVTARFAQLKVNSTYGGDTSTRVALGEFKVIATPGTAPSPAPINIAADTAGGHIVWMDPQSNYAPDPGRLLSAELGTNWIYMQANVRPSWVVGFWNDRAAQITGLGWVDPTSTDPNVRMNKVEIATSLDSPNGPWTDQGSWTLKRAADGGVAPFTFKNPTWARYVRYTADAAKQAVSREQPGQLLVLETPTSASYRSVLGEFGTSPQGDYEIQNPPPVVAPSYAPDANDTPETATPLALDASATSTAHTGEDVDWYEVTVPAGQNTLAFTLTGTPRVGVSLLLQDASGASVPMTFGPGDDPGSVIYKANVTPGAAYRVKVLQPPFSVVFTYDTSGSMGNYLGFVSEAIHSFSQAVTPGSQAVKIIPFEEQPLLDDWSDDPYALQTALEGEILGGGSSSAETSLINATDELATREGAKAVVLVTDADTTSYEKTLELWHRLGQIQPLVFSIHVGADFVIQTTTSLMQDWANSGGGFYQYTRSHGEMDRAFDRMATWLERPTQYTLSYAASFVKPPSSNGSPGSLKVVGANAGDPSKVPVASNVAVELILDTSGSMLEPLEGSTRIAIAKSVLTRLVRDKLPRGVPLALRVFGDTPSSCETRLATPLSPLDPDSMVAQIQGLHILSSVNTPIGASLKQVANDLKAVTGPRVVVLMTDGEENCGGNPSAALKALAKSGVDVHVNIVGFQINSKKLRTQMAGWAKLGRGTFFNASSSSNLNSALAQAMSAPYRVTDKDGKVVATGTVNGAAIQLPPGTYHVTVLTDPAVEFDAVVVAPKSSVVLTLPSAS